MHVRSAPLALVALAAVLAGAALAAPAADPAAATWHGWSPGAKVTLRSTTRFGSPGIPENVHERRETLREAGDAGFLLKVEARAAGGEWRPLDDVRLARSTGGLPLAGIAAEGAARPAGEEDVVVEGAPRRCAKTVAKGVDATSTRWIHADLGLLRAEVAGPGELRATLEVLRLSFRAPAGGKEVACREYRVALTGGGPATTYTLWRSPEVPGGLVRSESATGDAATGATTLVEVVGFEDAPPPAPAERPR